MSGPSTTLPTPNRAGMICFNRAGRVLICSSLGNDTCWVFPKGHIEEKETPWEAATRETEEECGVRAVPDSGDPIGTTVYVYKEETVVVEWYTGLADRTLNDSEAHWGFRLVRWVEWERAVSMLSFPDHRNLLRRSLCMPEVEEAGITVTDSREVE